MGARAQVQVKDAYSGESVFLYTHWGAEELPTVVARALDRGRSRWGDSEYLARIIFCEMVKSEGDLDGETGFGIGTSAHGDLDYPPIVVDDKNQTVTHGGLTIPYADYVRL